MTTLILRHEEIVRLIESEWAGENAAMRLETALPLTALERAPVLGHARLVMEHMAQDGGIRLTAKGNFSRKFVAAMVEAFRWPGLDPVNIAYHAKVLSEERFTPLHFLHALLALSRLGRKYKGYFRLTRRGEALLAPEAAGELMAVLFETVFKRYNLAYLDGHPAEDDFAPQIALTLFVMQRLAEAPRRSDELMETATHPMSRPRSDYPLPNPAAVFRLRVLRYLEWFGLVENLRPHAEEWKGETTLWRKTSLYDRFLTFHIDAEWR